jgi:hypothetical protein
MVYTEMCSEYQAICIQQNEVPIYYYDAVPEVLTSLIPRFAIQRDLKHGHRPTILISIISILIILCCSFLLPIAKQEASAPTKTFRTTTENHKIDKPTKP